MSDAETNRGKGGSAPAEESEPATGFRVIDRRRFAPDGSDRGEPESTVGSSAHATGAAPTSEAKTSGAAPESAASAAGSAAHPAGEPHAGGDFVMSDAPAGEAALEPSLSTLVLSLSTQALMHLGEIPDVTAGKPVRDLPAARSIIDLLALLERKTRGNLDAAESALFERVLYDLRMRFVEISRG
ncbi:MAG TPA: DUF1844 domain-containing protein [Candidatus Binatia bacterium]|nr:DUF1844 domain-containing protein [Candidatus Binatia bacterium]